MSWKVAFSTVKSDGSSTLVASNMYQDEDKNVRMDHLVIATVDDNTDEVIIAYYDIQIGNIKSARHCHIDDLVDTIESMDIPGIDSIMSDIKYNIWR